MASQVARGSDYEGRERLKLRLEEISGEVAQVKRRLEQLGDLGRPDHDRRIEEIFGELRGAAERLVEPDEDQEGEEKWSELVPEFERLWQRLERGLLELNLELERLEAEATDNAENPSGDVSDLEG
jgi:hypothetical protein